MRWLLLLFAFTLPAFAQTITWPGQVGNSVGYAAYHALTPTACPSHSSSGTLNNPIIIHDCTYTGSQSVSQSHIFFLSVDFNSGASGVSVSGADLLFMGCRFQSNQVGFYNVLLTGTGPVYFLYDSVTPLASFYASPPGLTVWPGGGSQLNSTTQTNGGNSPDGAEGYQYGFRSQGASNIWIDSADIWGFGNSVDMSLSGGTPTSNLTLTNCWIHDAAFAGTQSYHTDGPSFLDTNLTGPSNVLVQGCTVASLGNTNGAAFQQAGGGYNPVHLIGNYWSGFGFTMSPGDIGTHNFLNSAMVLNYWGTDIMPVFGGFHGTTLGAGSLWAANRIAFATGTTWTASTGGYTPVSGDNNKFWLLTNSSPASTTDTAYTSGGTSTNTVTVEPLPLSIDFKGQPSNTTSATQNITVYCTNSSNCTFSTFTLSGAGSAAYSIASNTCGAGINAGTNCQVGISFTPTNTAVYTAALNIPNNMPSPASTVLTVPLIGVGGIAASSPVIPPAPAASFAELRY